MIMSNKERKKSCLFIFFILIQTMLEAISIGSLYPMLLSIFSKDVKLFNNELFNLDLFEKSLVRMGSYHVMYLPAWVYYREPEVEVHKLENQTIWKELGLMKNIHHASITQLAPYNRDRVKEMIYNYYKKDFERWQMTE